MTSRFSKSKRLTTLQEKQSDKPIPRFKQRKSGPERELELFRKKHEAVRYLANLFSVFPLIKDEKRAAVEWEKYQRRYIMRDEWRGWWANFPDSNIAIVTGTLSGVSVIDADSEEGRRELEKLLPMDLKTPIAKTPKGWHYYFDHVEGVRNKVQFIPVCDVRGEGGYVVAPPSVVDGKEYSWLPGRSLEEIPVAEMPEKLLDKIFRSYGSANKETSAKGVAEPGRNQACLDYGLALLRQNHDDEYIREAMLAKGGDCQPSLLDDENEAKKLEGTIQWVLDCRGEKNLTEAGEASLTQRIRNWIEGASGIFENRHVFEELTIPPQQKVYVSVILGRLVEEGLIQREGKKRGQWRRIERELIKMNLFASKPETVDIVWPFGIHDMVKILPGNVIVVAGSKDAGKTAFMLNVIKNNMHRFNIHYFNSEMGEGELTLRLEKFKGVQPREWCFNAIGRNDNFADVIVPEGGNINIIDYMEIHDEFYKISGMINNIYRKLHGAIAIITLQKNPGRDEGLGGQRSLEKPRLALAIDQGLLKIVKAKNWQTRRNPNGLTIGFKIVDGCKFIQMGEWELPEIEKPRSRRR